MTGFTLEQIASFAEIFGALTIVTGIIFAWFQIRMHRTLQRDRIAINLMQTFYNPELARAVTLLQTLPDGGSAADFKALGNEYEEAAVIVTTSFETMGLLVYKRIAKFDLVMDLAGGILVSMHRKLEYWLQFKREEQDHPAWAEWFEWLALLARQHNADQNPAYERAAGWQP